MISIQLFHNIISFNLQRNVSSDHYFLVEVRNILFFNIEFPVEASKKHRVFNKRMSKKCLHISLQISLGCANSRETKKEDIFQRCVEGCR